MSARPTKSGVSWGGLKHLARRAYTWKNISMGPVIERKGLQQKAKPSESVGFPASDAAVEC